MFSLSFFLVLCWRNTMKDYSYFLLLKTLQWVFLERFSWRTKLFYLKRRNNLLTSRFVSWWFHSQVLHEVQGLILRSNSSLVSNESHIHLFFFPLDWYLWLTRFVNFHPCGIKHLVIYFHLIRKISGILLTYVKTQKQIAQVFLLFLFVEKWQHLLKKLRWNK